MYMYLPIPLNRPIMSLFLYTYTFLYLWNLSKKFNSHRAQLTLGSSCYALPS